MNKIAGGYSRWEETKITHPTLMQRVILSKVGTKKHNKSSCLLLGLFTVK